MIEATRNRIAANVKGGKSASPSLMNNQVEPQMRQSTSQTRRDFIHHSFTCTTPARSNLIFLVFFWTAGPFSPRTCEPDVVSDFLKLISRDRQAHKCAG